MDPVDCDGEAVPGTLWYLMSPPLVPLTFGGSHSDPAAPLSRWMTNGKLPNEAGMRRETPLVLLGRNGSTVSPAPRDTPGVRCLWTDDLARANAMHAPGWLLMIAPHDDATAPLAQWTSIKESGDPEKPVYI